MFLHSMKPWRKIELQPWKKGLLWTHHNSFSHKREPKHTNDTARLLQTQSDVHVHETASNKKAVKKFLPHFYIILDNSTLLCVTPKVNNIKKEKEKCKCLPHRAPVVCKLLSLSILILRLFSFFTLCHTGYECCELLALTAARAGLDQPIICLLPGFQPIGWHWALGLGG